MTNKKLKFQLSSAEVSGDQNNNDIALELTISERHYFLSNDNGNEVNLTNNGNQKIKIACSSLKLAHQARRLIKLREGLAGNGQEDDINKWVIFLNDLKQIPVNANTKTEIQLSNDDFEGGFEIGKIDIGVAGNSDWNITEKFKDHQTALHEFENLWKKYNNLTVLKTDEITNGLNFLYNFWIKKADVDNDSVEKKIYDLNVEITFEDRDFNNYKEFIDFGITFLSELKVWNECGFTTLQEIKNAIGNGFAIGNGNLFELNPEPVLKISDGKLVEKQTNGNDDDDDAQANITKIKNWIKNKKFAGVPIDTTPSSTTSFKPSVDQLLKFSGNDWFGTTHDGINYLEKTHEGDPKKTCGFKPGDIGGVDGKYNSHAENMSDTYISYFVQGKRITKIALDIFHAPDLDQAIELAFFGNHYLPDEQSDERYKKDDPKTLLYFNEVDGWSEKETLDFYHEVIKKKFSGNNDKPKIQKAYNIVNAFINLNLEIKGNTDNSPPIVLANKISQLKKYDISGNHAAGSEEEMKKKLYEHWKDKIEELKKGSDDYETKWLKMITDDNWKEEPYLSVLKDVYIRNGGYDRNNNKNIQILNQLEILFNLLKGAFQNSPTTEKNQLIAYKNLTDKETDAIKKIQRELWKIIQQQKMSGSDQWWGDEAISKAKSGDLTVIRNRIKSEMGEVGNDAYTTIVENKSEIKDNEENLLQVEIIWKTAKQAWKETTANNNLFEKLKSLRNDANKKIAWDAVNSYQKKWENNQWVNSTVGFAEGALNYLEVSINVSKKFKELYDGADTVEKLITDLQNYINGDEFKKLDSAKQTRFKEIIKPRLVAAKRIDIKSNQNDDEKKLVNLLKLDDLSSKYEESKEGLAAIKGDLKFLKGIKDAKSGDKSKLREAMGDNAEVVLQGLIEEMNKKHKQLKKFQDLSDKQEEDGPGNKKSGFFDSPWTIVLIAFGLLAVIGLVAYLMNKNSKSEEENTIV